MGSPIERYLSGSDTSRLTHSMKQGATMDPDSTARITKLQMKTGLPEDLITRNLDAIEAATKSADFNPTKFRKQSPIVAGWLAEDPKNVALIGEDLTKLSKLERHIRFIGDSFKEGRNTVKLMKIGEDAILDRATPEQRLEQAELEKFMGQAQADYGITGFFEGIPGAVANQLPIMVETIFGKTKAAVAGGAAGGAAGALVGAGSAAIAGQLGPQVVAPEELVTVPVAALAGARAGAKKGALAGWRYGAAIQTARMEGPLAYLDFEKLRDEDGKPLDRDVMLGAAAIVGAVNGGLEMLSFETMAKQIPGLRALGRPAVKKALMNQTTRQAFARFAKGVAVSMVTEGATEWMQSMTSSAAGELATMQSDGSIEELSTGAILDRIFSEEHIAQATAEARAGMQAGGGMPVAFAPLTAAIDLPRARRAQQNSQFFEALGATATDSKLIERLPEKMQEAVERLTKDGPVENVYAPLDSWNEHFEKLGIDPGAAAEEIFGDRSLYDEAQRTGEDLVIPTAVYAVKIAPSEHHRFFSDVLRLGPNEMSRIEAQEYLKRLDEEDKLRQAETDEKTAQSIETLQQTIETSLVQAGRPPEEARAAAKIKTNIIATMASKLGVDPMVLYGRTNTTIRGPAEDEQAAESDTKVLEQRWFKRDEARDAEIDQVMQDMIQLEEEVAGADPNDPEVRKKKALLDATEILRSFLYVGKKTESPPPKLRSKTGTPIERFTDEDAARAEEEKKFGVEPGLDPLSFAAMQPLDLDAIDQRFRELKKRVAEGERAAATPVDAAEMDRLAMFERNVIKSAVDIFTPEELQGPVRVKMVMEFRNKEDIVELAQKLYATQQYQENLLENGEQWVTGIRNFNDMFARATMTGDLRSLRDEYTRKGFGTVEEFWKEVQAPLRNAVKEKGKEFMQAARTNQEFDQRGQELAGVSGLINKKLEFFEDQSLTEAREATREIERLMTYGAPLNALMKANTNNDQVLARNTLINSDAAFQQMIEANAPQVWGWATSTGGPKLPPGFYSKAEKIIEQKMDKIASRDQLKALFKDVKTEEWKWLQLADFLESKERFTKQEVMQYLQMHRLRIVEVIPEGGELDEHAIHELTNEKVDEEIRSWIKDGVKIEYRRVGGTRESGTEYVWIWVIVAGNSDRVDSDDIFRTEAEARADAANTISDIDDPTSSQRADDLYNLIFDKASVDDELRADMERRAVEDWQDEHGAGGGGGESQYAGYVLGNKGDEYQEILFTVPAIDYEDPHWNMQGTVAHVRLTRRVTYDGKKTLHIEEIQSDLHEDARDFIDPNDKSRGRKGYKNQTAEDERENLINQRRQELADFKVRMHDKYPLKKVGTLGREDAFAGWQSQATFDEKQEYHLLIETISDLNDEQVEEQRKVPDAPFRTTWHEFVIKRAIRMAAEENVDLVTWSTGEQVSDIMGITMVADQLIYSPTQTRKDIGEPGEEIEVQGQLEVYKDDRVIKIFQVKDQAQLTEYVGQELADKLIAAPLESDDKQGDDQFHTLVGDQLKVSGKGMKGFYDKIVVDFIRKFSRQFGAEVGTSKVEVKSSNMGDLATGATEELTLAEPRRLSEISIQEKIFVAKVHSVTMTSKLRKAALEEGFTLFQPRTPGDRIRRAASRTKEGMIFEGSYHGEAEDKAYAAGYVPDDFEHEQGFTTEMGRFLTREEADAEFGSDISELLISDRALRDPEQVEHEIDQVYEQSTLPDKDEQRRIAMEALDRLKSGNYPPEVFAAENPLDAADEYKKKAKADAMAALRRLQGPPKLLNQPPRLSKRGQVLFETIQRLQGYLSDPNLSPEQYGSHERHINAIMPRYLVELDKATRPIEFRQAPRGKIRITRQGIDIQLLKDADVSTFMHESAHMYLEMMEDIATGVDAPLDLVKDYETLRKWLGVEAGELLTVEQHEMFARGFEAYLMEGRSPTPALRDVFIKFRVWLTQLYTDVTSLNVQLTDEVRMVFDRLVATQTEIEQAEKEISMSPLFTDPAQVGMTEDQAKNYSDAVIEARTEASETLVQRTMQQIRKEMSQVWLAEREKVRAMVASEINDDLVMQARALLSRGTLPDGSPLPENREAFKLSKVAINAQWGPQFLADLPKPTVFTAKIEGVHPNIAADILGFGSGDELLQALITSKDPTREIERITNERMRSRRFAGNLLKESELQSEATKAVHNEKRSQLLHLELQILASTNLPALKGLLRKVVRRIPPIDGIREQAEQMIASKKLRTLQPSVYQRAEQRAQREAMEAMLRGDIEQAFEEKQRELLNHELYRAAIKADEQSERIVEYMAKFQKKSTRERLTKAGGTFLAQIDSILTRFDFRKSISGKELDKRTTLKEFFEEQTALGINVSVPDALLNEAYSTHWKQLSIEELRGVHETVRQIEHLARLKNTLLANQRTRIFEDAKDAIVSGIYANHKPKDEVLDFAPGLLDRLKDFGDLAYAAHTKMEFLFEWLDGNEEQGPVWDHLFKPIIDAENAENTMKGAAAKKLREIFSVYTRQERALWFYNKEYIPEVKASFNKANLLTVALNWGNAYNRDALMRGYGWTEAQVNKLLERLDERDVRTVQSIWDYLETYWPEAEKLERELNGLPPSKVEATEWNTKFGPQRGGYYPILFDSKLSWRQSVLDTARMVKEMFGGHSARAMTRKGHLEERKNTGGKPLRLELGGLTQHVSDVIHDLTHRRAIIDVARLTEDPEVRAAIEKTMGRAMYRQITPWLQNVGTDQAGDYNNPLEGILGWARQGATVVNMGWKLTTAIAQPLSLTNTIKEIGAKAVMQGLNAVYGKPTQFKKTWDFVTKRSPFMKARLNNYDRDVRDALKKLNVAGVDAGPMSVIAAWTAPVRDTWFSMIGIMDMGVSLPSWMGAYTKAMNGNVKGLAKGDEKAAIDFADKVVRQTQGTGAAKDLATVQRGPNAIRIFTMFYTYFSGLFNQFAKATNQHTLDKNKGKYIGALMLLWFMPAVLAEIVLGRAPSADDDEDKWLKWFLKTEFSYPFQTVILLRDIINGMDQYGYEPSAALNAFETISKGGESVISSTFTDAEMTRADAKNAILASGYITHLPSRQIWTTLEYFYDWSQGNTEPSNPLEALYRAGVTGTPRDDRP